jgi:hypothetical protein
MYQCEPRKFALSKKFTFRGDNHHAAVVFKSHPFDGGRFNFKPATGFDWIVDE